MSYVSLVLPRNFDNLMVVRVDFFLKDKKYSLRYFPLGDDTSATKIV